MPVWVVADTPLLCDRIPVHFEKSPVSKLSEKMTVAPWTAICRAKSGIPANNMRAKIEVNKNFRWEYLEKDGKYDSSKR